MTEPQKRLYWRLWRDVCQAKGWHMAGGKIAWDPQRKCGRSAAVVAVAGQLAAAENRPCTLDDLRHAAHICALGRDKSSKSMSNREFNRIRALFRVLASPDDLRAVMEYENPEIAERRGLVQFIRVRAPEAYIRAIAFDRFATKEWEDIDLTSLRQLSMTLANRRARWNRGVEEASR